jgi:hypothetical protein
LLPRIRVPSGTDFAANAMILSAVNVESKDKDQDSV